MSQALAPAALLASLALVAAFLIWPARRRGFLARPILVVALLLGALPLLLVLAGWARFVDLPWVRFTRPLVTFPTAALGAAVGLRLLALRAQGFRRAFVEGATGLALLGASNAAAGLELGHPLDRLTVVVAIDRSRSIDLVPGAAARIDAEVRLAELGMRDDDRIASVVFGASAAIEDPARPKSRLPSAQRVEVPRDATDLGAAIRQALAAVPPDSAARVVLLSDGVATRGDVTEAALAAVALGIPVDAVPLEQTRAPSLRVVDVRLPASVAADEALALRVVTEASQESEVEVRVYRDGELVRRGPHRVAKGQAVLHLREPGGGPGLHRYDVEVSASDPRLDRAAEDNRGSAFVRVGGPSSALLLDADPTRAAPLATALRSAGFDVEIAGPTAIPADVGGLARFDLVALAEIEASRLTPSQLEAFGSYVRDLGGGLLLLGSDRAFGPGGYARTPIEEVSPVSFDLKQERRRATLSEVIAVDYSGSMSATAGGRTKLELANEAAARSAELLGRGDRLGVMHVDTEVRWTVPLGPVDDKARIAASIRGVGPGGGGIFVDLTLRAGFAALAREATQLKHLLLFSDGSDAEERDHAFSLVTQAERRGITTSVVALGQGADVAALARMAELGQGRFYLIEDATRLPTVFAQETVLASRSAILETPFVPKAAAGSSLFAGVDFGSAPPLGGYVVTLPKDRSQVHLLGPEDDPVLASWAAGVGRSAVFASDYRDRWGAAWTTWQGASRLFARLGREIARREADPDVRFEADVAGGELRLHAALRSELGPNDVFRRLRARIAGPDGFSRDVELEPVGAGSHAAALPLARPGAYLATLIDDERVTPLATSGAAFTPGEELHPTGTDRALLRRVTELTSGKFRDTLAGIFHDREGRRFAYDPLGDRLSAMAALALLAAVAGRRLTLPTLRRRTRRPAPSAGTTERRPEPARTLQALLATRESPESGAPPPHPGAPHPAPNRAASEGPGQKAPPLSARPVPAEGAPSSRRAPAPRGKSAAEILLERRRARARR